MINNPSLMEIIFYLRNPTPIEYRNNIRIEHAKEMLEETNDSIDEIAHKVGYTSNVYFCEAFKAKLGMSPSKYRSKFR